MASRDPHELTDLLSAWSCGDEGAEERLMALVYSDLRRMAARRLAGERQGHTLQPTALVHEAYLRLRAQKRVAWRNRRHFYAIAARAVRRVLLDHARQRLRQKRGGGEWRRVSLSALDDPPWGRPSELVALDEALHGLADMDPLKARIVELRFFGGLSVAEVAETMGSSPSTIARHWSVAKAWLTRELKRGTRESSRG